MVALLEGAVKYSKEFFNDTMPQNVKHGENTWDAQDKIFRHREDHLHRHLLYVAEKTSEFVKEYKIRHVLLGGHKDLFPKVKKHLPKDVQKKVIGTFVTELTIPLPALAKHAKMVIEELHEQEIVKKLEARLANSRR